MKITISQLALVPGACILSLFGTWRVVAPVSSMKLLGMDVDPTDLSLLNELSGNHAHNMGFGYLALLGIFYPSLRKTSLQGLLFCFGMYFTGRTSSYILNGAPNEDIQAGMVTEAVLFAISALGYYFETKGKAKES